MKTVESLKQALKKQVDLESTLDTIAKQGQAHYLKYFTSNLVLEYLTFFELIREEGYKELIEEDDELASIIEDVVGLLANAKEWMGPSVGHIEEQISKLTGYRDTLSDQVAVVAGYDDRLKMNEYVLRRRLSSPRASLLSNVTDESLVQQVMDFLFEYEDGMTINERIKGIYGQLPVRMSKLKLHEWIETALLGMKGIQVRDLENYLIYLTETFHPEGVKGYGIVMKPIFEELRGFDALYTDIVSEAILEPLEDHMYGLKEVLERCVSLYTYTAVVINNMLGLMYVMNESSYNQESEAVEGCIKLLDLVNHRSEEDVIIDAEIVVGLDAISMTFEDLTMENGKWDGLLEEVKSGYVDEIINLGLDKTYDRLSALYILQSSSYFAPLELEQGDFQIIDETTLILKKNEFISRVDEINTGESRWAKRARIANLLSVIHVVHKTQNEVQQYLLDAIGSCKDDLEKVGTFVVLNDMMVE